MSKTNFIICILCIISSSLCAQNQDSTQTEFRDSTELKEVIIQEKKNNNCLESGYLKSVEQFSIYAAKKSDLIRLDDLMVNRSKNAGRQIYAKVAGINIWESDASGLQTDIAARGLDPNRSSSFNLRQNGYDISADALGYPDAYYVPPTEGLDKIEIVRGAASLQYGTQFGGMINYKMQRGDLSTPLRINIQQTAGSFGFTNTFLSLGGTKSKIQYYTFYQYRQGKGWRPNSNFDAHNYYADIKYNINEKLSIDAQYSMLQYIAQQPGGLTDIQFKDNPKQSNRSRNYFQVKWNLMATSIQYKITSKSKLSSQFFGLIAGRNAIGNLNNIQQQDILYTTRDAFKDQYKNFGNETKWLYTYRANDKQAFVFLLGSRIYRGNTFKKQDLGDTTSSPLFQFYRETLQDGSDYSFPSLNTAIFAEHLFTFGQFSITPGCRYEFINTTAEGKYREIYTFNNIVLRDTTIFEDRNRKRHIFLAGIGASYKPNNYLEIFANISQNYRAINFNDVRTSIAGLRVDEQLQDEKGYSFDFGLRGLFRDIFNYNANLYYLVYNNRISEVNRKDTLTFIAYRYRTNISKSRSLGIDISTEVDLLRIKPDASQDFSLKLFCNIAWLNAIYLKSEEEAIIGNTLEYAPDWICRSGIEFRYKDFNIGTGIHYVSKQFTDATNAEQGTVNAIAGQIPDYYVMDINASYKYKWFTAKATFNNITNNSYFTRRSAGYPGPGIIPAEPFNFLATLIFDIGIKQ